MPRGDRGPRDASPCACRHHPVARALAAAVGGLDHVHERESDRAQPPVIDGAATWCARSVRLVPLVLDGGRTPGGPASTIVDVTGTLRGSSAPARCRATAC